VGQDPRYLVRIYVLLLTEGGQAETLEVGADRTQGSQRVGEDPRYYIARISPSPEAGSPDLKRM